jgi:hypothetical protein
MIRRAASVFPIRTSPMSARSWTRHAVRRCRGTHAAPTALFPSGRLGCLLAACAVSMFLPFLGREAALQASDPVPVAAGGVVPNPLSIRNSHLMVAVDWPTGVARMLARRSHLTRRCGVRRVFFWPPPPRTARPRQIRYSPARPCWGAPSPARPARRRSSARFPGAAHLRRALKSSC